jgi:hypothetical protein
VIYHHHLGRLLFLGRSFLLGFTRKRTQFYLNVALLLLLSIGTIVLKSSLLIGSCTTAVAARTEELSISVEEGPQIARLDDDR